MHIPADIHFYENPLTAVREAKQNRYIVEALMNKPPEWIEKARLDNLTIRDTNEELRQAYTAKGQTFKQQLALERVGESDAMLKMMGEYMQLLRAGRVDFWKYMGVEGFIRQIDAWRPAKWMLKGLVCARHPGRFSARGARRILQRLGIRCRTEVSVMSAFRLVPAAAGGFLDERDEPLRRVRRKELLRRWQAAHLRGAPELPLRRFIPVRSERRLPAASDLPLDRPL